MGMQIIKEPIKGVRIGLAILAFVLIIPILGTGGGSSGTESEKIVWSDIIMHEVLPEPTGKKGKILTNSDESLSIYIHKQSKEDYNKYVEKCKKKGFTIDSKNDTDSYDAFNEKGYKLRIYYNDYSKEYNIDLKSPLKTKENAWPDSSLANMLPKPNSTKGQVESDSGKYFTYYATNISEEEFNNYVDKLKDSGFNIDHYKSDNSYSARNKSGYKVSISYEGFNTMKISITASEEKENTTSEDTKKDETTTNPSNKGLREDFKKAMDSYEKYMDEYVEFMKKYSKSDGSDLSLLKDYTKMLEKYEKFTKDFEKWENEDLNDSEAKYYIEVQTRVNKKLASIQ